MPSIEMKPSFLEFKKLAKRCALVPAYTELPADMETPVTVYTKLSAQKPHGVLLESVEGGGKLGRYSFISVTHHSKFESRGRNVSIEGPAKKESIQSHDPLNELRELMAELKPAILPELPAFCGGAVGMISYDMVRNFEKLPDQVKDDLGIPDMLFLLTEEGVIFDHWKHKMILVRWNRIASKSDAEIKKAYSKSAAALNRLSNEILTHSARPAELKTSAKNKALKVTSNFTAREFCDGVKKVKEYIRAGDVIQTVLSQRFEIDSKVNPLLAYRALRMVNPSPYLYLLKLGDFSLAGSSPEILVRKEKSLATTRPIAGTRRRGADERQDLANEKDLLKDPKERAEHLMLVDLGRNDLGRCCVPGTVRVPNFMTVERYSHVMHLVSTVEGTLRKDEDAFSVFRACFPAGTVAGAPKIRAMEIIEETERMRRGTYAGSVGYFSYSGDMDMAITIRTFLFRNNKIYVQAGAGIVADSVPEHEEKETRSKAQALFSAIELAQRNLR